MRPRILVTGFEPFGHADGNPSARVVRELRKRVPRGIDLHARILPVVAGKVATLLPALLRRLRPDAVLCLGEARGSPTVCVERLAINLLAFRMHDNAGVLIRDRPIVKDGPAAYWATLPTRRIAAAIRRQSIACQRSHNADTFICNLAMYLALHWACRQSPAVQAGFLHLPSLPGQRVAGRKPSASMPLAVQVKAVRAALKTIAADPSSGGRKTSTVSAGPL